MKLFKKRKKKYIFEIVTYPKSRRVYVKCNGYYLKRDYLTGLIEFENDYAYANNFKGYGENQIRKFIDEAKEQFYGKFKVNYKEVIIVE